MESTEKITGTQLSLLIFSFIAPTVILVIPGLMAKFSKQDAWITILPASLIGALSIWLMIKLSERYPNQSIIEYSSQIIGKWPAKALGLYFIYYWLNFDFIILNQHIQFINTVLLHRSPAIVISLTLVFLCAIAVTMGVEAIARCNGYLALLILILLIPLLVLMLSESDPSRLRPVMSKGIVPVLQGSVFPAAYFSQFFILGWLLPHLNRPQIKSKASFIGLFNIASLLGITLIPLIMVFGPLTDKLTFPVLSVIQYIGLKGSLERLEALAVVIWVMGCFVKISLTIFILCASIGDLIQIKRYKSFVMPVTILSVIGSVSVFQNYATDLNNYLSYSYPVYALFTQIMLPLGLLLIDSIKRGLRKAVL